MHGGSFSLMAGGSITPASFVKLLSGSDNQAVLCSTGDRCFGISSQWHRFPPWEGLDDGNVAIVNETLAVYALPADVTAFLQLGGTVAVGDYLKSDSSGHGVTAGSDGDEYGAQALEAGNNNDIIRVALVRGMRGA